MKASFRSSETSIQGFTVISSELQRTVWDDDDLLKTFDGGATDLELEAWIEGYTHGHERGRIVGRRTLQRELRRLIGAA
jgi:hypothetical protein